MVAAQDKNIKQILFVIGSLDKGGAESQLALLATELIKQDIDVTVFCTESGGVLHDTIDSSGGRIVSGKFEKNSSRLKKKIMLLGAFWRLACFVCKYRPDVLHAYLPLTNFLGAIAGRLGGIRLVITARRALGKHQDRYPLWKPFDRIANCLSDLVIVNSKAVADDTIRRDGIDPQKIVLIYNGIHAGMFKPDRKRRQNMRTALHLAPKVIAIISVANLIPYKGHAELIVAFADLNKKYSNTKLFLAGEDRGIGDALKQQSIDLGVENHVIFLGRHDDVPSLLSGMDVAVQASHEEGFSNAVLEYLAAGLPLVATNVGGNPEAIDGMPGCFLCPPKNSAILQERLEMVIAGLPEREDIRNKRLGLIGDRFSVDAMVNSYLAVYNQQRS